MNQGWLCEFFVVSIDDAPNAMPDQCGGKKHDLAAVGFVYLRSDRLPNCPLGKNVQLGGGSLVSLRRMSDLTGKKG